MKMKPHPRWRAGLLLLALVYSAPLFAGSDEAADYAALQTILAEVPGPEDFKTTERALAWEKAFALRSITQAENFLRDHPRSNRRRVAELAIVRAAAPADGVGGDQTNYLKAKPLIAALLADASLPDGDRRDVLSADIEGRLNALGHGPMPAPPEQWQEVEEQLTRLSQQPGDGRRYSGMVVYYVMTLSQHDEARASQVLRDLAQSPVERVARYASEQLRVLGLIGRRIELSFVALDGREFDLAHWRGKVVLIDFWATWCGPCVAELPNVKQVYAAYHDQGFEVVGIALENAKLTPKDTPEQVAAKLEAAKQVLIDFTTKEQMPWPQYFDGKYWKNDISTKYGINGIPAMFLLDQDGKVVTTNARGARLEAEVKRLLNL